MVFDLDCIINNQSFSDWISILNRKYPKKELFTKEHKRIRNLINEVVKTEYENCEAIKEKRKQFEEELKKITRDVTSRERYEYMS